MDPTYDRILNELDFLLKSRFFRRKEKQKEFLSCFHRVYKENNKLVPVTISELRKRLYDDDARCDNTISVHISKLTEYLQEVYERGEGKGRAGIKLDPDIKGIYELLPIEFVRQAPEIAHAQCSDRVSDRRSEISFGGNKSSNRASLGQSVEEAIVFGLKGVDAKRLIQFQTAAMGIMWGSLLVGLAVLIVLLIGLPHWPTMPFRGLFLTGVLSTCACIAILARPITILRDIPFGRWWGDLFCLYRGGAVALARYSGRCTVEGCCGELSIVQEAQERANLLPMRTKRWVIVCKNVPTEHPRTPFDFTVLGQAQTTDVSSEPELARPS